ncbi:conserved hypothetical protein [Coccidioides posadasii str. Silveira]|uniref:Uncharacterized protein n=1 Tax=Coccidioides posadasii (strain RMSCC 757 / Silveira) TaxID=443226 RepID=E9CRM3_COCPS|nr:conserved hypothetical protein [Coccidioides posadasii str. Silveira]
MIVMFPRGAGMIILPRRAAVCMPALLTAEENICPGPRPYQIMPYTRLFTHQSEEERQKGRHRTISATARWTSLAKNFVLVLLMYCFLVQWSVAV